MRRKVFSNEHPMTLTALTNVARTSLPVGQAQAALPLAEEAARMADRLYAEAPASKHASILATLAEVRHANGDEHGARVALVRAQALLATVKEPPASHVRYVRKVQARVCAGGTDTGSSVSAGCAAPASPATSARVRSG